MKRAFNRKNSPDHRGADNFGPPICYNTTGYISVEVVATGFSAEDVHCAIEQ